MAEEHDEALEEQDTSEKKLAEVHKRAMERFDEAALPQLEQRAESLAARRFVAIPGAQWEGEWADPFTNAIKLEINKVGRGLEKIIRDYNENRIVPDFRPAGGKGDEESAATLDGLHRADSYAFKAQQARDNAFLEAAAGGFGAYRLANEWADPYDKESDEQRINPALLIVDADQRVFFDPDAKTYDKSDAKYCFVLTAQTRRAFEEEHECRLADWPDLSLRQSQYDWFTPDVVIKGEYYEVEEVDDTILVFTHELSGEEQRWFESELEEGEAAELRRKGWKVRKRDGRRRRVRKYVMTGAEVLKDQGYIAGDRIPVVPVYGVRYFVDNQERFKGYVQDKMDAQRLYNSSVSHVAETNAQSPREIPIFAAQQMPPKLQQLWANQVVDRHAYALVEPLIDGEGNIVSAGPIGKVEAPQLSAVAAALLQIANNDLLEDQQDGADQVKANTSADALEFAATRVDARSGIYLDNMRQSVQCEGEIYLSMAADVYVEPGREVETMTDDGDDGRAILQEMVADKQGRVLYRNDFSRGKYKVVVDVTEATATRRDKTVKSALNTAGIAQQIGDMELAQAALITAIANQDGEGMADLQKFARNRGVQLGLLEPTDEEKAILEQAKEGAAPDPLVAAQAGALEAGAAKDAALAEKAVADTELSRAKTVETLAKAANERREAAMPEASQEPRGFSLRRLFGR